MWSSTGLRQLLSDRHSVLTTVINGLHDVKKRCLISISLDSLVIVVVSLPYQSLRCGV